MNEKNKIIPINKLKVKYNKRLVGYLVQTNQNYCFEYDQEWLKNGFSISPFFLPLQPGIFTSKPNQLFGVFADSLPDGWGLKLFNAMLAKKGINLQKISPLTLLSLLGKNCKGGLDYEPHQPLTLLNKHFNLDDLNNQINHLLNDQRLSVDLDQLYYLAGSSGGARPKAYIQINDEYWIIKFITHQENKKTGWAEYQANLLAKKCGINTNQCQLFDSQITNGYFGAKRFDRIGHQKVHLISLAGILEQDYQIPNLDYISLLQTIQLVSIKPQIDLYEAYKIMVFNVFLPNRDDHSKNFSFLYNEEEKGYRLAPFYDITETPYLTQHHLAINGNGNPTIDDMLTVAQKMNLSIEKCHNIICHIQTIIKQNKK